MGLKRFNSFTVLIMCMIIGYLYIYFRGFIAGRGGATSKHANNKDNRHPHTHPPPSRPPARYEILVKNGYPFGEYLVDIKGKLHRPVRSWPEPWQTAHTEAPLAAVWQFSGTQRRPLPPRRTNSDRRWTSEPQQVWNETSSGERGSDRVAGPAFTSLPLYPPGSIWVRVVNAQARPGGAESGELYRTFLSNI